MKHNYMRSNREDHICRYWLVLFFLKNYVFIEEGNPSEEVVIAEKLDGIDIDDLGNLEDSSRLVFINGECQLYQLSEQSFLYFWLRI